MTTKAAVLTSSAAPSVIQKVASKNCVAATGKSNAPPPSAKLMVGMFPTLSTACRFHQMYFQTENEAGLFLLTSLSALCFLTEPNLIPQWNSGRHLPKGTARLHVICSHAATDDAAAIWIYAAIGTARGRGPICAPTLIAPGFDVLFAVAVHGMLSGDSPSRCQRYSSTSSLDSSSITKVSTPYSSPRTHRTMPAAT